MDRDNVLVLPTSAEVIDLRFDGGDLIVETALREVFRIDTEKRAIKAN